MRINKTNQLGAPGDTLRSETGMSGNQAWKVRDALQNRVSRNRWEGREKLKQASCQTSIYRKFKGEEKGQQRLGNSDNRTHILGWQPPQTQNKSDSAQGP